MDARVADLFYYAVIGAPTRKMTNKEKFTDAWDKVFRIAFNINHRNHKEQNQETLDEDAGVQAMKIPNEETIKLKNHLERITGMYEDIVVKYFSERKYLLDITEESREMKRQLYEIGSLDRVSLLYPDIGDSKRGSVDIRSLNGKGTGGIVNIGQSYVNILKSGKNYKLSDILIGFINGDVYIFKAESLKDTDVEPKMTPINWNMPLHTQVYRFFHPGSFDVAQIKATQSMIAEHGLEYVTRLFVKEHVGIV